MTPHTLSESLYYVHAADGVRLAITEVQGPDARPEKGAETFLLVHGFAQNRLAFTAGAIPSELIARGARVLMGELRGHGASRAEMSAARASSARAWSLGTHLNLDFPALIGRACDIGRVERVHVFGHSMGGILGYALIGMNDPRIATLTTFAAPVVLGVDRPLLRALASVAWPLLRIGGPDVVPVDLLLRTVAPLVTRPVRRGILGWSREVARLANPAGGDPTRIAEILRTADPVSKQVMLEMAVLAVTARGRIGGIDLVRAVTESRVPIAAVVGGRDVFGGRASVQPIARGRGRRRIIVIDEAGHVDVTMGHSSVRIVRELWDFLIPRGAIS